MKQWLSLLPQRGLFCIIHSITSTRTPHYLAAGNKYVWSHVYSITRPVTQVTGTPCVINHKARLYFIWKQNQTYNMTVTWNVSYSYLFGRFEKKHWGLSYIMLLSIHICVYFFILASSTFLHHLYCSSHFHFQCLCYWITSALYAKGKSMLCPAKCCPVFAIIYKGRGLTWVLWSLLPRGNKEDGMWLRVPDTIKAMYTCPGQQGQIWTNAQERMDAFYPAL